MSKAMKLFRPRNLLVLGALALLVLAVFAFAAVNVVPETGAGEQTGVVSGYTLSNIAWTVDAVNPDEMDLVEFDVASTSGTAGDANEVYARVTGGPWVTCAEAPANHWTCTFAGGVTVQSITTLQVVAVE